MIVFPMVVLLSLIEAKLEEDYDLQPRFGEKYKIYQKTVRIFGPALVLGCSGFYPLVCWFSGRHQIGGKLIWAFIKH